MPANYSDCRCTISRDRVPGALYATYFVEGVNNQSLDWHWQLDSTAKYVTV